MQRNGGSQIDSLAPTCYQLLCNNLAISCLHLKGFLSFYDVVLKGVYLTSACLPFLLQRDSSFSQPNRSHVLWCLGNGNIFESFSSIHKAEIIANKCTRMFIFTHKITNVQLRPHVNFDRNLFFFGFIFGSFVDAKVRHYLVALLWIFPPWRTCGCLLGFRKFHKIL